MTTLSDAWRTGRSERLSKRPAPPIVVKLVKALGEKLPTWQGVRTFAYTAGGLGLVDYAIWEAHHLAGYAAAGVSLLWLEYAGRRR
ncbi:hypothetical protein RB614_37720 [Phytohabitans sp. ZYX-F-186]|uniref:Uncharacterized protein n=1 Tax=Phytohabitans maris TaxID=3071409 RepID=A0ABU0ZT82_9ACTN|nr:hypothetical protein [Phytohabitans sp. ZYX-F-186]MDQ7910248.1 hypothetical protein [Phytohabitans sp. ZYX-F-186]